MKNILLFFSAIFFITSCNSVPLQIQTSIDTPSATPQLTTLTKDWDRLMSGENVLLDFALSPDGKLLAVYTNKSIYLLELYNSNETVVEKFTDNSYRSFTPGALVFTVDGTRLLISGKFDNQPVKIWDIKSGKWESVISDTTKLQLITEMEFSPKGDTLLVRTTSRSLSRCEGPEDNLILIDFDEKVGENLFETNGCMIAPSRYRFTGAGKLVIFNGTMSPEYSVYFVDSHTGKVISLELYDSEEDGSFYDISSNGEIAAIRDNQKQMTNFIDLTSMKVVRVLQGQLIVKLISNEKDFFVYDTKTELWGFWKEGKQNCVYDDLKFMDIYANSRISSNQELITTFTYDKELKVFNIHNCELIKEISFSE